MLFHCLNSNIYSYLKTSGGKSFNLYLNVFIFSTTVSIRHLWQLKTVVFLHWCLICLFYRDNQHIVMLSVTFYINCLWLMLSLLMLIVIMLCRDSEQCFNVVKVIRWVSLCSLSLGWMLRRHWEPLYNVIKLFCHNWHVGTIS